MAKTVYVFLAEGFEEIEAVATIDLLRRAGLAVVTVAVGDSREVAGAHHVPIVADQALADIAPAGADAFVLPGGLPGVTNLGASDTLRRIIAEAHQAGKVIGAICAAPSILGQLGLLEGKVATCYPSFEPQLGGYIPTSEGVAVAGNIITARSAGVTFEFALALITALLDADTAKAVASAVIYHR